MVLRGSGGPGAPGTVHIHMFGGANVKAKTTSVTNLLQVVHLTDWTVEGLKALWLHFKLGPSRSLRKADLERGLAVHMESHGVEILITSTEPGRRPMQQHAE